MNKIKYGLSNVVIFPIKEQTSEKTVYEEPLKLLGAVNLKLDAQGDAYNFYADNISYYGTYTNNGYSGELEIALITDEFKLKILGWKKGKNGELIETSDAKGVSFALGFQFEGDQKATKHLYYNVSCGRPADTHQTKGDKMEVETDTIPITISSRLDKPVIKAKIEQGETGYDAFFTKVQEIEIQPEA